MWAAEAGKLLGPEVGAGKVTAGMWEGDPGAQDPALLWRLLDLTEPLNLWGPLSPTVLAPKALW